VLSVFYFYIMDRVDITLDDIDLFSCCYEGDTVDKKYCIAVVPIRIRLQNFQTTSSAKVGLVAFCML